MLYLGCVYFLLSFLAQHGINGFLLTGFSLHPSVPKLPQYKQYGRSMVLVGGNLDENNTEIYNKIVELAGGKGVAKIGLITVANDFPEKSYAEYRDIFIQYGVLEVTYIPAHRRHQNQTVVDLIYNQTGFFFGGGEPARIIDAFFGDYNEFTPALIALHQMFDAGAVISGTSAGNMCQTANVMILKGSSYDALRFGAFPDIAGDDSEESNYDQLVYAASGGLGFMKEAVLDSHFSVRGRQGRLIRLLADTKELKKGSIKGVGIDEDTALVVTHADTEHTTGQVLGSAGVSIIDVADANFSGQPRFHISNVTMSYLTHGDVYFFYNESTRFDAATKHPTKEHEHTNGTLHSNYIFSSYEFNRIARSVFDSETSKDACGVTYDTHPRFRVDLSAPDQLAEGWTEKNSSTTISYQGLHVEIREDDGHCK